MKIVQRLLIAASLQLSQLFICRSKKQNCEAPTTNPGCGTSELGGLTEFDQWRKWTSNNNKQAANKQLVSKMNTWLQK